MFKYILVPATGTETDIAVFTTALAVARLSPAHLEFLHVRIDVQQAGVAMVGAEMGGVGYDQMLASLQRQVASRQKEAEVTFSDFCERERLIICSEPASDLPSAEWRIETGSEAVLFADHGRAADLLVVGRGEAAAFDVLEAALMATGRPVLIAPPSASGRLSGTVAVAWKNTPEAAKAVAAAEPFMEMAKQVVIYTVDEDAVTNDPSCERLQHALSWRNPRIIMQHLRRNGRPAVEILLAAAGDAHADLLVMGGYGHNRLHEMIFGGFTRHVLTGADLPVLMAH